MRLDCKVWLKHIETNNELKINWLAYRIGLKYQHSTYEMEELFADSLH